jgi:hypothetical protein
VFLATCVVLWRLSVRLPTVLTILQQYWDVILIGVLGFCLLFVILWKVPKWQISNMLNIQDRLTAENAARQTLAQIIGGAVLLVGLFFTWANLNIAQENIKITQDTATKSQATATKNLELAQEGQITDRFTKAIAQLGEQGSDKLAVRLGGIYALERIARESKADHWPIMEILTASVREKAPWPPKQPKDAQPSKGDQLPLKKRPAMRTALREDPVATPTLAPPQLTADIQAILTVLGRRTQTYGNGESLRLHLAKTDLRGASLWGAKLQGARFQGAQLQGADLTRACLQAADLTNAQLQWTSLWEAQLKGAFLAGANLEGAYGLTVEQLAAVATLYNAQLDPPLPEQIRQQYPQLLERPQQ